MIAGPSPSPTPSFPADLFPETRSLTAAILEPSALHASRYPQATGHREQGEHALADVMSTGIQCGSGELSTALRMAARRAAFQSLMCF